MAAYVQHVSGGVQASGIGLAFPNNTVSGNAIVVLLLHSYLGCPPSVADSQGNLYTAKGVHTSPGDGFPWIFTAVSGASAPNTITATFACGNIRGILIVEASGLESDPFDVQAGAENTSSPANAGSLTPSSNGALIIANFFRQVNLNATATSAPFTLRDNAGQVAYLTGVQTIAAPILPDATCDASLTYKVWGITAAFKAAAVVATSTPSRMRMGMGI